MGSTLPAHTIPLNHPSNSLLRGRIALHRNNDGTISTSVYRKPTHTDNFDSHHPLVHKVAVFQILVSSRGNVLCSTIVFPQTELDHILSALERNQNPQGVLECFSKPRLKVSHESEPQYNHQLQCPISEVLPRQSLRSKCASIFSTPHYPKK